jgi:hypothetical protein
VVPGCGAAQQHRFLANTWSIREHASFCDQGEHTVAESGGFEGALGADEEGREPEAGSGADSLALTVSMAQARHDPQLSRSASEYLARQRQLVDLQLKHFDEAHQLAIAAECERSDLRTAEIGSEFAPRF